MEVGSKVYVWRHGKPAVGTFSGEEIIGNVVKIFAAGRLVEIESILDGKTYVMEPEVVYEVGTGPITDLKYQVVYEDNYV